MTINHQTKTFKAIPWQEDGETYNLVATVRHDDSCGNGHNSFAITGELSRGRRIEACGCLHDEIAQRIPELEPYLKWHLCSTDGPLHYVANTTYHASTIPEYQGKFYFYLENKRIKIVDEDEKAAMIEKYGDSAKFKTYPNSMAKGPDFDAARRCAIWPDATPEQLTSKDALNERLPQLLAEFKADVESLGLTY